ncbi:MAG: matrixin family metalloprotease [Pirellulaceae bacterium]|nr:matrixin family metalloprotease [Pirellulaceae bacterium]
MLRYLFRQSPGRSDVPFRRRFRRPVMETLEVRLPMDAEGTAWLHVPELTLSFAPDGTELAGRPSVLSSELSALADEAQWREVILSAFQAWAEPLGTQVRAIGDQGVAFGVAGPTQGDPRFGDIRIGAVALATDVIAISVPHHELVSGTWAGDVLLNSNAQLDNLDQLFSVALHEAGHVFGLGHSTDPRSPMFVHGVSDVLTPTAQDIATLQSLYGLAGDQESGGRETDDHDDDGRPNDDPESADHLESGSGSLTPPRYATAGSIVTASDVDYFELVPNAEALEDWEDLEVLSVTVRATGSERWIPQVSVLDDKGRVVESRLLVNFDGVMLLQVDDAHADKPYRIKVEPAETTGLSSTGRYELTAEFAAQPIELDALVQGSLSGQHAEARAYGLHAETTQLIHLVLTVDSIEQETTAVLWVVVHDPDGRLVARIAARPGQTRSASTTLLAPGDYRVEFVAATPDGSPFPELDFAFAGEVISIPIGPGISDPTSKPLLPCDDPLANLNYCAPPSTAITDPIVLPASTSFVVPPAPQVTPPSPWPDPSGWYWGVSPANIGSGWQNILNPGDVDGNGVLTPVDVLLVVNYLNANTTPGPLPTYPGSAPYLDVNNDNLVSPVDALAVINALNQPSSGASEGESSGTAAEGVNNAVGAWDVPLNDSDRWLEQLARDRTRRQHGPRLA